MWRTVKLGDALKTGAGGTPLKSKKEYYEGGNIKWLLSGAVCERDIHDSKTHISEEGLTNSSAKLLNHRGPDKTGNYTDTDFLAKFYRLSILDSFKPDYQGLSNLIYNSCSV